MFARFTLPDVPAVSRRTVTAALIVGVMALAAASSFDRYLLGVGACIGLALGTLNFRMVSLSVVKVGAREDENKRRPLALNTMARMGIISVITIGLLFLSFNLGFGVLAGLAVFQLLLLVNVARSMFKLGPPTDGGEGVVDADVLDVVERSDDTRGGA
jgi:hypothetical protein